jgi:hypothetical protein
LKNSDQLKLVIPSNTQSKLQGSFGRSFGFIFLFGELILKDFVERIGPSRSMIDNRNIKINDFLESRNLKE